MIECYRWAGSCEIGLATGADLPGAGLNIWQRVLPSRHRAHGAGPLGLRASGPHHRQSFRRHGTGSCSQGSVIMSLLLRDRVVHGLVRAVLRSIAPLSHSSSQGLTRPSTGRMLACNCLPQALWFGRIRRSILTVVLISIALNVGMWLERILIIWNTLFARLRRVHVAAVLPDPLGLAAAVRAAWPFRVHVPVLHPPGSGRAYVRGPRPVPPGGSVVSGPLLAEFGDADALLRAARLIRREGHRALDALTPFPLADIDAILDIKPSRIRLRHADRGLRRGGLRLWHAMVQRGRGLPDQRRGTAAPTPGPCSCSCPSRSACWPPRWPASSPS